MNPDLFPIFSLNDFRALGQVINPVINSRQPLTPREKEQRKRKKQIADKSRKRNRK